MRVIKSTDPIDVHHPVFLVFGQPGVGKSTLGYSMKDVLALDFDLGAHRAANRRDTVQVPTWSVVADIMEHPQALEPYAALSVDTVGRCLDAMTVDIIERNMKLGRDGALSLQGWGVLKTRFRTWISQLRALGKDVLLLAHDKEDKDGDTRIVRPDIAGGSYGEVMKTADFIGYLSMSGRDRVLDFSPTDRWVGKNPGQWAPFKIPPSAKATDFMAELYARGRDALGLISEASASVTKDAEDWRARIVALGTAAEYNAAIPAIKNLSATLQPQVAKMLMDAAKSAGVPFDKAAKRFVEPKKAEAFGDEPVPQGVFE